MQIENDEDLKLLSVMLDKFDPASALWRAVEVKNTLDIISRIDIRAPIMDLGCAEGNIAQVVFKDKKIDVGLDNWKELLIKTKNAGIYKFLVLADARLMPFAGNSFNLVFSNSVIEHIEDIDKVLEEVSYILKPKGLFIFTVPTDKFGEYLFFYRVFSRIRLKRIANWYKTKRIELLHHYNLFGKEEWETRLNKFGLKVVNAQGYLSKTFLSIWDLVAAAGFLLRKLKLGFTEKLIKKLVYANFLRINDSKENISLESSACLVIVAAKL